MQGNTCINPKPLTGRKEEKIATMHPKWHKLHGSVPASERALEARLILTFADEAN
jgi:hypothetical protein